MIIAITDIVAIAIAMIMFTMEVMSAWFKAEHSIISTATPN